MLNNEYLFKISLMGNPLKQIITIIGQLTGNTSTDWVQKVLEGSINTSGVEMLSHRLWLEPQMVKLILPLTNPGKSFTKLRTTYYQGAFAGIIFFNKADRTSFKAVNDWYTEFRSVISNPKIPMALVAFQTNIEDVTDNEALLVSTKLGLKYFVIAPKAKEGIAHIFTELVRDFLAESL